MHVGTDDEVEVIAKDDDMLQVKTSARTGEGVSDAFMKLTRLIYQKQFIEKGLVNEPDTQEDSSTIKDLRAGAQTTSKKGCC